MVPTPDADPPSLEAKGADSLSAPGTSGERQGLGNAVQPWLLWLSEAAAATATLYWDYFTTSQSG